MAAAPAADVIGTVGVADESMRVVDPVDEILGGGVGPDAEAVGALVVRHIPVLVEEVVGAVPVEVAVGVVQPVAGRHEVVGRALGIAGKIGSDDGHGSTLLSGDFELRQKFPDGLEGVIGGLLAERGLGRRHPLLQEVDATKDRLGGGRQELVQGPEGGGEGVGPVLRRHAGLVISGLPGRVDADRQLRRDVG